MGSPLEPHNNVDPILANLSLLMILWMDEILHHLRNPEILDSLVNTNQQRFPMVSKWCRISSIYSRGVSLGVMGFPY